MRGEREVMAVVEKRDGLNAGVGLQRNRLRIGPEGVDAGAPKADGEQQTGGEPVEARLRFRAG